MTGGRGLPSLRPIFDSTLESGHTEAAVFPIFPISHAILTKLARGSPLSLVTLSP